MMNIIGFLFIALHFCDGLPTEFSPLVNSNESVTDDTDSNGERRLSPVANDMCQALSLLNQIVFITQSPDRVDLNTCMDQEFQDEQICQHVRFTSFKVPLFGHLLILDVEINHDFLSSLLMETVYQTEGSGIKAEVAPENCFYQGRVRGISNSLVVLTTCHGLSGYFITNEDLYSIYPLDIKCSNSQIAHKVVKLSPPTSLPYGNNSTMFQSYQRHEQHASECLRNVKISKPHLETLMKNVSTTKILRVAFVCDYFLMRRLEEYSNGVKPFFIELANLMNALLLELKGPKLRLVYIETWNSSEIFSKPWDYRSMLSEFLRYRQTTMDYGDEFDVAHLWTSREFHHTELGIAVKDSICTNRAVSVSQVTDVKDLMLAAWSGLDAILDVLGSEHSSSDSCPCNNPMLCFSEPVIETRLPWLPGSPRAIFLSTLTRLDVCLYDPAATPTYYQNCGNGIVERGEECDCIDKERCRFTDPCCDPELCLLVPWTTCRHGDCCHNCTLRSTNEVCRAPSSECDVPEFCDGKTGECPLDAMVQDGQECLTGVGSCYSGSCVSFDEQCHRLWNKESTGAADDCYETFNVAGNLDGHCGWDPLTGTYARCSMRDVKCGLLHCAGGSSRPLIGRNHIMSKSTGVSNGKSYECKIVNGEHEDGTHMLGMVQDGSLCSDSGGLCVNGKCVNLNQSTCPIDERGNVCSGNGVCTSQVRCFCSHGFTGYNCELRIIRAAPITTVAPPTWRPDAQLVLREGDLNTTGNSSVVMQGEAEFHVSSGIGAVWLVFMLASIVIVSVILFVVCLACYRRRSPPARRKHKSHPHRSRHNSNPSNSQHSSRVKFHNELPSYRAYKLRHFLRGSGASETESEKTGGQPCSEKADGPDAATVEQPLPLSAVDRLSLHPERSILKNSSLNRRREEKSLAASVPEEVAMVNKDSSGELKREDSDIAEPLVEDVVVTKVESNHDEEDGVLNHEMLVETGSSQSPNFVKLRQSSPCYVKKLRASPNSIRNSRRD